jgi:putative tryptophan/tyrosine transport system substrate-binding protein
LQAAKREDANAILVLTDPVTYISRQQIVALTGKLRLPGIYPLGDFVEAGGLMSYDPNNQAQYRRAAYYVDKILKGANAGDLPIEQPIKFELIINLKAAKQIRLTISPNVLARADRVIK